MASEEDATSSDTSRPPRRRRAAPTIDLAATEVAAATAAEEGSAADAPTSPPQSNGGDARAAPRQRVLPWAVAVAAVAGAALATIIFAALVSFGSLGVRDADVTELSARLARLEAEKGQRVEPSAALNDLAARLARAEAALAAPQPAAGIPALAERMTAIEAASKALAGRIDDLSRRLDAAAKAVDDISQAAADRPPQVASDKTDIDRLGERVAALESKLTTSAPNAPADRAVRLAVLASALKSAVERGVPFASELVAVKPLAAASKSLGALEPFAATGLPTAAALATELSSLIPAMSHTAEVPTRGGFFDRLQSGASRLVRIRPLDEPRGDDPADVLTRVEFKATRADIAGILAELAKLPAPVRAPAASWIAKAAAHDAALAAAQGFAAEAQDALGKTAP